MTSKEEIIHVVDYDCGNLGSIVNMFRRIGVPAKLTRDPKDIETANKIILPGVGAFDQCIKNLEHYGFKDVLNQRVLEDRVPILGVCVGFQLMSKSSEEGVLEGLGWIKAHTKDMRKLVDPTENAKFPHIGWNFFDRTKDHVLFKNMPNDDPRFYFVHTYHVVCDDAATDMLATTSYKGLQVTAAAGSKNIIGMQCHPEKSHKYGMQLFKNFAKWEPEL